MGGPLEFAENWQRYLPEAPVIFEVAAVQDGYVTGWDAESRHDFRQPWRWTKVETDTVNPAVGISDIVSIGTKLERKLSQKSMPPASIRRRGSQTVLSVGNWKYAPKPTKLILEKIA